MLLVGLRQALVYLQRVDERTFWLRFLMQVVPEDVRLVEPFSKWIEQNQQSELLDERLLFPLVFAGLSYDGEPAHFAFLDL